MRGKDACTNRIVGYSMALPYLLALYQMHLQFARNVDMENLQACMMEVERQLDLMDSVLENKLTRAATMLSNGADELRAQLGKARGSIARARASGLDPPERARLWGGDAAELLRAVD